MSTPFLGVVICIIGSVLTATVSVVSGSAWAQSAGDVVIVGNSSQEQAQLQAYWDQLLELNAANPQPPEQALPSDQPGTVPQIPEVGQPGTSTPTLELPSGQPLTDTPAQKLPSGQSGIPGMEPLPEQPGPTPILELPSGQPGINP